MINGDPLLPEMIGQNQGLGHDLGHTPGLVLAHDQDHAHLQGGVALVLEVKPLQDSCKHTLLHSEIVGSQGESTVT